MQKFLRTMMLVALMLVPFASHAQTMYLTVADSTATNSYVPVYGLYVDDFVRCQTIYPAEMLSSMTGENILSLTYYLSSPAAASWGVAQFVVNVKEVTGTTLSAFEDMTGATTVYTGSLDATAATMEIEFTTPYAYQGGNLLVEIYNTLEGTFKSASFYGKNVNGASWQGNNGTSVDNITGSAKNFMPKTTFMYGAAPTCFKVTNLAIDATATTSSSLTLTWTDALNTNATYSVYDMSDTTLVQANITGTTFTVTGLNANTSYSFAVMTDCGAGDVTGLTNPVSGRTACGAISTLPYTVGFEADELQGTTNVLRLPWCWTRYASGTGSYTYYPYSNTSYVHEGSRALYFYCGTGTTYPDTQAVILPELDVTSYPMNANRVSFWARMSSASYSNVVYVGTMSDPTDLNTFTLVEQVTVSGNTHTKYSVSLETAAATNAYVAIISLRNTTNQGYMSLDDLTLEEMPSCMDVTGLTASDITSSSVTLSWADGGNASATYSVYDMSDSTLIMSGITALTYTVTDLTANTPYVFGVQANCAAGDAPFATVNARTSCAVEAMPFTESFGASLSSDPCWRGATGTTAADVFAGTATLTLTTPSQWTYASAENSGIEAGHYYKNIYGTSCKSWMITPAIDLSDATSAQLSFDAVFTGYNSATPASGFESNSSQAFMVIVSADGGNTWLEANATKWQNEGGNYTLASLAGTSYQTQVINLNAYLGDTIKIAFYAQSTTSGGDNNLHIDNIAVTEVPSCPSITGLTLDSLVGTTAYISWDDNETGYNVEVRQGETVIDTLYMLVDGNSAIIGNMAIDNDYQVYVRSICGTDAGQWTSPLNIHVGYCLPNPTSVDNNGISSVSFGGMTNTTHNAVNGNAMYENFSNMAGSVPASTTASVDITYATGYTYGTIIWVDWNNNMGFEANEVVYAGTSEGSNPTTLTATFTVPATQELGNYRMRIMGADSYFDDYTGSLEAAAAADPCATFPWGVAEDYTLIVTEAPACMAVTDLTVDSVTANSVFLSWNGDAATYDIYSSTGVVVATGITTTNYEITGLTGSTSYTFGVVANCGTSTASAVTIDATTDCEGGSCTITIAAVDGYGDGWNGAVLIINQNGAAVATYSMASQGLYSTTIYDTFQVSVCSNSPVNFSWTAGQYDDEISFSIIDGGNATVYTVADASELTAGVIYTLASPCPSCVMPAITLDGVTQSTATISWTGNAPSYNVYNNDVFVINTTANTYTFGGLTPGTAYTFGVEAMCAADDVSGMATVSAFTTCADVTALPYEYGFESGLGCWSSVNGSADGVDWSVIGNNSSFTAHSGSYVAMSNSYYSGPMHANAWLISPKFILPVLGTGDTLNFSWWHRVSEYYPTELYDVMISTTTNDTSAFTTTLLAVSPDSTSEWIQKVVNLSSYAGQSIYLAFHHHDSYDQNYLLIDDIYMGVGAAPQPAPDSMLVNIAVNDATMGTTIPAPGVHYFYEGDTASVIAVPNTGYQLTGWSFVMTYAGSTIYDTTVNVAVTNFFDLFGDFVVGPGDNVYAFSVTANFAAGEAEPDTVTVNITVSDPTQGTTNPAPGTHYFTDGQTLSVVALPATGYEIAGWYLQVIDNTGDTVIDQAVPLAEEDVFDLFDSPITVSPVYDGYIFNVEPVFTAGGVGENDSLIIITAVNDATMGTIVPAPGTHVYYANDTFSVYAVPNEGYHVESWHISVMYEGMILQDTTLNIGINEIFSLDTADYYLGMTYSFTANFAAGTIPGGDDTVFTVITAVNDASMGTINPAAGTHTYVVGDEFHISATANSGYYLYGYHFVISHPQYGMMIDTTVDMNTVSPDELYEMLNYIVDEEMLGFTFQVTAIFERNEGIDDIDMDDVTIYSTDNMIVVRGAEGKQVVLFDVNGRMMSREANAGERVEFRVSNSGVYLVKVGDAAAKRVVVIR
ncbi:MAG: choice-of-anchor J domain-containing protein [Bacteroidales bacterium]|nr:choice-of-anchor J domain-containing protein [Bacteroidales bacterium]